MVIGTSGRVRMQTPKLLPKSFFGFLPLYIGVETVLGITIFNKCSGIYGILALFTGHPLTAIQWVSYLWSSFTLLIYAQGLFQVHHPNLLTYCQILITYSFDTICTCFFTIYFCSHWFTEESNAGDNINSSTTVDKYNQGASESKEFFWTMTLTLIALVSRFYFNFILASFTQQLFLHPKYMIDQDDVEQDLKNKSIIVQWWIKSKKRCYYTSKRFLA
ncbi:hypothetical protein TPHA_0E01770 [Tetrapisispora phaffii CBS 4417]|uniref:Uncharacterized protein n=1 Tax=Tetrapisispora phaffii (strain ATCC 24235 / CBS 4417 / NBRC 1672 / NRRL Y-8282 / UCD 70-5) TaxID=1071381 RepID=G8BTP2_TETPH|nr:hypothetical protein TPHA_0E01770 [Tetrapisispora phaffii CBS 4417]CCE63270.1 hypothetical protein TPHA_0E01770 [Tetrapisispora phaffii CBS 4417]